MEQPNTISPAIEARIHAVVKAHNWSLCRENNQIVGRFSKLDKTKISKKSI